ncbi:Zn-ribbon domain-containing OB-fold protein [Gordonia terrae]
MYSLTVNHQQWTAQPTDPYAVIVVQLDEQDDLRFVSRIVDTPVERVRIGMRVRVVFGDLGDGLYAPYFTASEDTE